MGRVGESANLWPAKRNEGQGDPGGGCAGCFSDA